MLVTHRQQQVIGVDGLRIERNRLGLRFRGWLDGRRGLRSLGARIVLFFVALLVLVQGMGAILVIQANSQIGVTSFRAEGPGKARFTGK